MAERRANVAPPWREPGTARFGRRPVLVSCAASHGGTSSSWRARGQSEFFVQFFKHFHCLESFHKLEWNSRRSGTPVPQSSAVAEERIPSSTTARSHIHQRRIDGVHGVGSRSAPREPVSTQHRTIIVVTCIRPGPESPALGTSTDVFQTADKLAQAAVAELADFVAIEVSEPILHGDVSAPRPLCSGTPFRRAAFQSKPGTGARPAYAVGEVSRIPRATPYRQSLVDLRPRLILDLVRDGRWLVRDPVRAHRIREARAHSAIVIPLIAGDAVLGLVGLYRRAESAPFDVDDLQAAISFADRAAQCLDVVRDRIQGRVHARLLQRNLLPEVLPSLGAIEAAEGQLPVEGSGGEWFDIIPLSGARAALVVGATRGRGVDAAVGMSQLRAMIITLAIQDLAPDEILAHLDDMATRLGEHLLSGRLPSDMKYAGSSCLFVVYDPVTGRCTSSRAGGSQLVVIHPDGVVSAPGLPSHPTLGTDGHPYEATEVDVPPGTVLVLTSGGIDDAHRDGEATATTEHLHEVVNRSGPDVRKIIESTCRDMALGHEPALLVARAQALDAKNVASLAVPSDPAAVAAVRAWTRRQLATWMLDELASTTTLIVSELVTNAIRYATGPTELRLINDGPTLICEVSDTNGAVPRLHKARPSDEGGRGLSIVSELTQHQGTRLTARGKTVWTQQSHST
ncbi:SpoIIE family protein phosphatase [Streptomyces sp. NPDC052107]|uniref:ATP-binding SpoIIE family protein phosphatase n=1 Tax=Streptomyces sp. NPDC052107 TaxID=3155632 RepID=UPI0034234740